MADNYLALDCLRGETTKITLQVTDGGVPFPLTNLKVYFTVVQNYGQVPFIDYNSTDDPDYVYVVPSTGTVLITIPYKTKWPFTRGFYSVVVEDVTVEEAVCFMHGDWLIAPIAKDLSGE